MVALITAIEGPVCAGKTTLANGLRDYVGSSMTVIVPDYADFVGGVNMPAADPVSFDEERSALLELLAIENRRFESFPAFFGGEASLRIIDRSILTLIGHCSGLDATKASDSSFLDLGRLIVGDSEVAVFPQLVIYLDVDLDTQLDRNDGKFASDSIFLDPHLNDGFRSFFASLVLNGNPRWGIWLDARQSPADVLDQAITFLITRNDSDAASRTELLK